MLRFLGRKFLFTFLVSKYLIFFIRNYRQNILNTKQLILIHSHLLMSVYNNIVVNKIKQQQMLTLFFKLRTTNKQQVCCYVNLYIAFSQKLLGNTFGIFCIMVINL